MSILQKLELLIAAERAIQEAPIEKELPNWLSEQIAIIKKVIKMFWMEPTDDFTRHQISYLLRAEYCLDSRWDINPEKGRHRISVTGKSLPNTTLSFTV